MRNLKKFLALVLAMMMALSMVATANAASWNSAGGPFDDGNGVLPEFDEGVSVVTGMKIFEGDDNGDFRPSANITRAEVAAIVYRLATGDVKNAEGKDDSYLYTHVAPFYDVDPSAWYAGYVGYLWNAEIIKGSNTERTAFNPSGNVTGYEALAMVLRAMGYDENDEFTGAGWQIRVGQTANDRGLLDNVNTTNYGAGHLNAAARRDTIAEIIFQAAISATVVYTPAFGYQTANISVGVGNRVDNTSLGRANFGLGWNRGIVVGNQDTGESGTKMTFANDTRPQNFPSTAYIYGGVYNSDDDVVDDNEVVSRTLTFDHVTPLGQFGHANKIWYNINNNHTYAWFDEATEAKTVYTRDEVTDGDLTNVNSRLVEVAKAAGFTVGTDSTSGNVLAFASDKYDRMDPLDAHDADYKFAANAKYIIDSDKAISEKEDTVTSPIKMYALISNSANKKLDVIISLDAEVAKIYDTNTTHTDPRIVLYEATLGGDTPRSPSSNKGEVKVGNLTKDSVQTLGVNVEAWVVDGTTKADDAADKADRDLNSLYRTIAVKSGPSGLVSTIDNTTGTIYLADGTKLEKSYLYDVVKGGCIPQDPISAGVSYSFVVDQWGRYLGLDTDPGYTFIYGTFADHSYGDVGSADLKYVVTGVDANGQRITNHPLNHIKGTSAADTDPFFIMNGTAYNTKVEIARRDYGNTLAGNQIAPGVYRAGVITTDGKWLVNDDDTNGIGYPGIYSIADKAGRDWEFTAADVANGFKDVSTDPTQGQLLLTPNTEFYVVSGTGIGTTNTQTVKKYVGMKDFLDNASAVSIDVNYQDTIGGVVITDDPNLTYDVAYMTDVDIYHSVGGLNNNRMVTKVFVYEEAVNRVNNATLFYAHSSEPTTLKIAGYESDYEQFELWQGNTKVNYFIENANTITDSDKFYTLVKTGTKNGVDVYAATKVTNTTSPAIDANRVPGPGMLPGNCWTEQTFDYFATNDTSTARIGGAGADNIYRVDNATVVDLTVLARHDAGEAATHSAHNEIKNVKDLFYATSVGYDVEVSIVNDGVNTSLIYVIGIVKPTV